MKTLIGLPMQYPSFPINRRAFLGRYAGAIGTLALTYLLDQDRAVARGATGTSGLIGQISGSIDERRARARSVICLFQHGGPSQMDLFDPKPALTKYQGSPYPGQLEIHFDKQAGKLL